jgi:hypothetical protein
MADNAGPPIVIAHAIYINPEPHYNKQLHQLYRGTSFNSLQLLLNKKNIL